MLILVECESTKDQVDKEGDKKILERLLIKMDIVPDHVTKLCQLLENGFTTLQIINLLYKFRDYDSKLPARGAKELLIYLGENDNLQNPDQINQMVEKVGFWNYHILVHQSTKGTTISFIRYNTILMLLCLLV